VYGPICFIQGFEEVLEEVLEKIDTRRELHVEVAVVFENKPSYVGNSESLFNVATTMLKISLTSAFSEESWATEQ
jgi:hypothetical protein